MPRIIDVHDVRRRSSPWRIRVGDVLELNATGVRVSSGQDTVELLGSFVQGILGDHNEVLSPEAVPNKILLRARRPGKALLSVILGDPFHGHQTISVGVEVD